MPDSEYPYLQGIWHYTRGSAFLGKGRIDSAKAELNKIKQLIPGAILDEIMIRGDTGKTLLELAAISLEGEILFEEGDAENATKIFREAVDMQDQLTYSEPPEWSQSVRLFLGDALIQAGENNKAELIFIEDLEEFREYGWTLFGLWQSLELQNKTDEANDVKIRFEKSWRKADIELRRPRL